MANQGTYGTLNHTGQNKTNIPENILAVILLSEKPVFRLVSFVFDISWSSYDLVHILLLHITTLRTSRPPWRICFYDEGIADKSLLSLKVQLITFITLHSHSPPPFRSSGCRFIAQPAWLNGVRLRQTRLCQVINLLWVINSFCTISYTLAIVLFYILCVLVFLNTFLNDLCQSEGEGLPSNSDIFSFFHTKWQLRRLLIADNTDTMWYQHSHTVGSQALLEVIFLSFRWLLLL